MSDGDARRALTALEAAAGTALAAGPTAIDLATLEQAVDTAAVRYDRDGDQHYDVISAFIKSIRGSDVDAALHYLARMIEAGEDARFIARRLVVHASEDIGLADPTALLAATAAAAGRRAHRHARGPDQPGPGHHPPGAGARSPTPWSRPSTRRWPTSEAGLGRRGAAAAARRPLRRARRSSGTRSATATRTTSPRGGRASSTRRTPWSGATTTGRPGAGAERHAGRAAGPSCGAAIRGDEAPSRTQTAKRTR